MTAAPEATATPRQGPWQITAHYAAPALVFLALVVAFLRFHEYDLLLPESLILLGSAAFIGATIGGISRLRPQTLAPALMALTLFAYLFCRQEAVNAAVDVARFTSAWTGYPVIVLAALGLFIFAAIYLTCIVLRRHIDAIVMAVFGTMVLTTIVLPTETGGEPVQTGALPKNLKDLPPVIHIILDEHIGLASLPTDFQESRKAREIIPTIYKDFALYSHAYSRFAETKFSLTSLMNRDVGGNVEDFLQDNKYTHWAKENAWFATLKEQGYAIRAYQSVWFDMCGGPQPADSCYRYSFFSPNAIQRSSLTTWQRARALTVKLIIGREALQLGPLVSMEALDRFRADIAEAPRGVAYIVHVLIPHYGYLYGDDCTLLDPSEWHREGYGTDGVYSAEERNIYYRRYLDQLVCTNRVMDSLFAELKQLGVYDEATIIVHGDHGSRLGEQPYIIDTPEAFTSQDEIDHYATLLAIKAPGLAPGMHDEPAPLQRIFAETFLGGSREDSPEPGQVFTRNSSDTGFGAFEFKWPDQATPIVDRPPDAERSAAAAAGDIRSTLR